MTDFEEAYRRYYAQMYRLARVMLYDRQESKDAVSDVFARLLHGGEMPAKDKTERYLMTAVRNRCCDVLAHKSVRERVEKLFLQDASCTPDAPDDDRLERLMQFVESRLPPRSQQIFRLRFLREMSYDDVASQLGVSKVTVYNHLSQSLRQIREYFKTETAKR